MPYAVRQSLAAAEAMVLTSHQENFGIVVAEALSVGTPVLISDKINIWREVAQGGAGIIEADTIDGAQTVLNKWLRLSKSEREKMSRAAEETFQKYFEIESSTDRLLTFLASLN